MKSTVIFTLLFILQTSIVKAQYIKNSFNTYFSCNVHFPVGNRLVEEKEFITPSLHENMEKIVSFSIAGISTVKPFLSLGAGLDKTLYSAWSYKDYTHYSGSMVRETSIFPVFQFHFPWQERGFFNRFNPNLRLSPFGGVSVATFQAPPSGVHQAGNIDISSLLTSRDFFAGMKGAVGMEVILHRYIGFTASYGMRYLRVSSNLFNDQQLFQSTVSAGIYLRFLNDKRFYY